MLEDFENVRPHLLAVALRIVGSVHDAEDIVQSAYLRARRADSAEIQNPQGWLTTITARLSLDHLRSQRRHRELPLPEKDPADEALAPEEHALRRDDVSRALLVVLTQLTPPQRVALVLHDIFGVPFEQVASVLETSPASAKKLASRARHRIDPEQPTDPAVHAEHTRVVAAFLEAAGSGDLERLTRLLAPDAVRVADRTLLPSQTPTVVHGARAVAKETRSFRHRILMGVPLLIDGLPGAVIAPGGIPLITVRLTIDGGAVHRVDLAPYRREHLRVPGTTSGVVRMLRSPRGGPVPTDRR
ncbi:MULTISPECIES: sigma-70 family RNA polymerase sigma factor [unclassified Brachybacterium]|uniref:sigma-70 family RNA polymerase sigma factor n=1 Tax=unclassified Brachybacterium TaxID=2623841 RepID=UPI0036091F67